MWLHGLHPVAAALGNSARRVKRLLLTEEAEATLAERLPKPWPIAPERTERAKLDALLGRDTVHQGAALLADLLPPPALSATLERPGPVLVLDQVTDPRNVGAILRSAAAFGARPGMAGPAPRPIGAIAGSVAASARPWLAMKLISI